MYKIRGQGNGVATKSLSRWRVYHQPRLHKKRTVSRSFCYVVGKTLFQYPDNNFLSSFAFLALSVTSTLSPLVAVS